MSGDIKNMVAFKPSRKGYDKSDVNRYIEEMNIRFTSSEAAMTARIKELEERLASVDRGGSERIELERLMHDNAELRAEIKKLTDVLAESESAKPNECDFSGNQGYREISEKLGSIILKANVDAERIVAEAEKEAAKQLSEAGKRAEEIRLDSAVSARLMTSKVKEKLIAMTEEYVSGLRAISDDSVREYRKLYEELRIKFEAIGVREEGNAAVVSPCPSCGIASSDNANPHGGVLNR